ncbi:MAG: 4-hydroxythreonine-4-phosphate dehydrogenase PdxA [Elusimicrobia bacterium]|nr:4-hydroxythreonine-4-phosphate dehydrogenase PdxA [Elusimicrobiota bacterium]
MTEQEKPVLGITVGDVAGIGPEIIAKACLEPEIYHLCRPLLIGDVKIFQDSKRFPVKSFTIKVINRPSEAVFEFGRINIINIDNIKMAELKIGQVQKMCGQAAVEYIKEAVRLALAGEIKGLVTAPISKEAMHLAGFKYNGHTELLAELTNTGKYVMLLTGGTLKVILLTRHIALKDVSKNITAEKITEAIELGDKGLIFFGLDSPRIVVCSLNPHMGEGGILGNEEKEILIPAVNQAKKKGYHVDGPISSDSAFYYAAGGKYDLAIAMYHDQGMIPIKLLAYKRSVNMTLGLPFVRTSPCHGTAYDLAGKWVADSGSMLEALKVAAKACRYSELK